METTNPTHAHVGHEAHGGNCLRTELDVARTLDDAGLYLEHHGWCQGDMYQPITGRLPRACALGAINIVTFHAPVTAIEAVNRDDADGLHVRLVICEFADYIDDGIWRGDDTPAAVVWKFNDHPDATAQLVTRAFRAAAARHRATWDA